MTHAPRIPNDQRSAADKGAHAPEQALHEDRRDVTTGAQSGQPGDADVNLDEQGRFGNLKQNLTHHRQVQDR